MNIATIGVHHIRIQPTYEELKPPQLFGLLENLQVSSLPMRN